MPQKYNIVLTPSLESSKIFTQFAQENFRTLYDGYLLGDNSIPHISLCQFSGTKKQLEQVIEKLKLLNYSPAYSPTLQSLNIVKLGGSFVGKHAADLGVVRTPEIMELHRIVTEVVEKVGLQPLNAKGDLLYRPHLTLAFFPPQTALSVYNPEELFSEYTPFTVAVGSADENWQFTKILANQTDLSLSTANILANCFGYSQAQVERFLNIANSMTVGLDCFLKGNIFKGNYSEEEQKSICEELVRIVSAEFADKRIANKLYITTAGAPGSGKTFFIEDKYSIRPNNTINDLNAVYVEPDRSVLPKLQMYLQCLEDQKGPQAAYTKWRDASNYIANFMLIKAVCEDLNIIHGTTASSERIIEIYENLKEIGYKIEVKLLFADVEDRVGSINYRETTSGRVQLTKEDMIGKVAPIYHRMNDCYFEYADQVSMFYQPGCFWSEETAIKCFAVYNKEDGIVRVLPNSQKYIDALTIEIDRELIKEQRVAAELKGFISRWEFARTCSPRLLTQCTKYLTVKDQNEEPAAQTLQQNKEKLGSNRATFL